jgi:hypothetical protein
MTTRKTGKAKTSDATPDAKTIKAEGNAEKTAEAQGTIDSSAAGFPIVGIDPAVNHDKGLEKEIREEACA